MLMIMTMLLSSIMLLKGWRRVPLLNNTWHVVIININLVLGLTLDLVCFSAFLMLYWCTLSSGCVVYGQDLCISFASYSLLSVCFLLGGCRCIPVWMNGYM